MNPNFLVYLAGPITGLTFDGAKDWRADARAVLKGMSKGMIESLDPMRNKEYLSKEHILGDSYPTLMSSQRGIYGRDRFDCLRADALLVNMIGATRVSIGTVMEIAWADSMKKPIVLAMEDEGNLHDHAMLREACYWQTSSLDEAMATLVSILCPELGDAA